MKKGSQMMKGAALLGAATFISKLLSALYRVPLQNLTGDEGFYIYQQGYPFYGLAMTFALSGLPGFLSKVFAEETNVQERKKVAGDYFWLLLAGCLLIWIVLFGFSEYLALLMGDQRLKSVLQVTSFVFLPVPFLALWRGWYQGQLDMVPTAVSQVLEQCVRVGFILVVAGLFASGKLSLYVMGAWAMLGGVAGEMVSGLYLAFVSRQQGIIPRSIPKRLRAFERPLSRLVKEGGLLCLYTSFLILFQMIDAFMVKRQLASSGMSEAAAKAAKGIYDRGQPFVQLGLVIALAMASSFLPSLVRLFRQGNLQGYEATGQTFLRITAALGAAAASGLAVLMPYFNQGLFRDTLGTNTLRVFVMAIGLMSFIQVYQNFFQSEGQVASLAVYGLLGLLGKSVSTWYLTEMFGMMGASIGTLCGLIITFAGLLFTSRKAFRAAWLKDCFAGKLCLSLGIMILLLTIFNGIIGTVSSRGTALFVSVLGVMLGGIAFLGTSLLVGLFTPKEMEALPFFKKKIIK